MTTEILVEETIESTRYRKVPRAELVAALVKRDGTKCMFPGASHELDFTVEEGPQEVTLDHHIPQWYGKENGWTMDQIWALDNLRLMCKRHNAQKGDRVPNPDGTLPERATRTFRYRRQKRAERAEICTGCSAGRNLGPDEVCASCGSGPKPDRWPRWAKVKSTECLHDGVFWCWACSIGITPIRGATETILIGGEGGE